MPEKKIKHKIKQNKTRKDESIVEQGKQRLVIVKVKGFDEEGLVSSCQAWISSELAFTGYWGVCCGGRGRWCDNDWRTKRSVPVNENV
jgi:hypothetical protein